MQFPKLPKNLSEITKWIRTAPLRGAFGIETVICDKFFGNFQDCKIALFDHFWTNFEIFKNQGLWELETLKSVRICSDLFRCIWIRSDAFECIWMRSNTFLF